MVEVWMFGDSPSSRDSHHYGIGEAVPLTLLTRATPCGRRLSAKAESGIINIMIDKFTPGLDNYGHYDGVGTHLFAFGCKIADNAGFDALFFMSKTKLVDYYARKLGARVVFNNEMIIEHEAFRRLIKEYYE
jgi:hypothetical protein